MKLAWQHLWSRRFDLALVPRWDADHYHATFIAYFSGAPWRVGYSEKVIEHKYRVNRGFDRLLIHALEDGVLKHEVERSLDVLRLLGGKVQEDRPELWVGEADDAFAEGVFREYAVQPGQ